MNTDRRSFISAMVAAIVGALTGIGNLFTKKKDATLAAVTTLETPVTITVMSSITLALDGVLIEKSVWRFGADGRLKSVEPIPPELLPNQPMVVEYPPAPMNEETIRQIEKLMADRRREPWLPVPRITPCAPPASGTQGT